MTKCKHTLSAKVCRYCSGHDELAARVAELENAIRLGGALLRGYRLALGATNWQEPTPSVSDGRACSKCGKRVPWKQEPVLCTDCFVGPRTSEAPTVVEDDFVVGDRVRILPDPCSSPTGNEGRIGLVTDVHDRGPRIPALYCVFGIEGNAYVGRLTADCLERCNAPRLNEAKPLELSKKALQSWKLYAHFVGWPNQNGVPELLARCINEGEDALRALGVYGTTPTGSTGHNG